MRPTKWLILLLAPLLFCCSSGGQGRHGTFRIGIDPSWFPLNFKEEQPYVTGYVEELLLEIARYSGVAFEIIPGNWDSLLDGLASEHYDAILSSTPPYSFNLAKYDFSNNFLDTGPVLVAAPDKKGSQLEQLSGELVGILAGDPAALLLERHPTIVIRTFNSIPDLLNAVVAGQIEAALLDRLPAMNFVKDLYAGKLHIASDPLTPAGLHAVALKRKPDRFIRAFNSALEQMKKRKAIETLQQKWNLS